MNLSTLHLPGLALLFLSMLRLLGINLVLTEKENVCVLKKKKSKRKQDRIEEKQSQYFYFGRQETNVFLS